MNLLCLPNRELKNIYDSKVLTPSKNSLSFYEGVFNSQVNS